MKKGSLWIILGVLLLLGAVGLTLYNLQEDRAAKKAADNVLSQLQELLPEEVPDGALDAMGLNESRSDAESAAAEEAADADGLIPWEMDPTQDMPTVTIDGYRYIGVVEIPSRDLKLPVMEEWDYTRLKIAPCRYSGSVYQDNMVICGHNYYGHFSEVRYIGVGEEVIFTDAVGNVFYYTVANVETLKPSQVEEMTTGDWDLTLFTCNTGAQTRRAVRCYRVEA